MPEELPPVFSYMPFYIFLTKRKNKNLFLKEKHRWLTTYFQGKDLSLKKPWAAFPYRFYISKGNDGDQRLLSMPQPVSAIEMSLFVSVFEHEFMNTFGTQGFSIRKPLRRKDVFYVNHKKSTILYSQSALVPGKNWIERSGSFFQHHPCGRISSFYGSSLLMKTNEKFPVNSVMDYQRCFPSIYTHSFSWLFTLEGHEGLLASQFGSSNFYSSLDKICENINGQETHGLCAGPEFSRLAAEVILESIDNKTVLLLKQKHQLIKGRDYQVFRYVDDHFLFAKDRETMDLVRKALCKESLPFSLSFNTSKTGPIPVFDKKNIRAFERAKRAAKSIGLYLSARPKHHKLVCFELLLARYERWLSRLYKGNAFSYKRCSSYILSSVAKELNRSSFENGLLHKCPNYCLFISDLIDFCFKICFGQLTYSSSLYLSQMIFSISERTQNAVDVMASIQKTINLHRNLWNLQEVSEHFDLLFSLYSCGLKLPDEILDSLIDHAIQVKDPFQIASFYVLLDKCPEKSVKYSPLIKKVIFQACDSFFAKRHFQDGFDKPESWFLLLFVNCPKLSYSERSQISAVLLELFTAYAPTESGVAHGLIQSYLLKNNGTFINWDFFQPGETKKWMFTTTKRILFNNGTSGSYA